MKKELQFDKYGYALTKVTGRRCYGRRLHVYTCFVSNTQDEAMFTSKYNSQGIFKDIIRIKKLKNAMKNKNIVECFAYCLKDKYEFRDYYNHNFYAFMKCLPEKIILND